MTNLLLKVLVDFLYEPESTDSTKDDIILAPVSKEEHDQIITKLNHLKRRERTILSICIVITILISLFASGSDYFINGYFSYSMVQRVLNFVIAFFVLTCIIWIINTGIFYKLKSEYIAKLEYYKLSNMQEKVEENIFDSSLMMSYKYLDQYYFQTREQAKKGFRITVAVTVFGAVILFIGILMMFINKTDSSVITVASGVIVEFISAVMFYLYNRTIQSMGNYHDKLFLSQNISIALKVSDSLSDDKKDEVKAKIISELMANINGYIVNSGKDGEETNKETSK